MAAPAPRRRSLAMIYVLAAAGLALMAYLAFGPNPWQETLDFSREAKQETRTWSYVVVGRWWGSLATLGIILFTLIAWQFRPRLPAAESAEDNEKENKSPGRGDLGVSREILNAFVALAVLLSAWLMWPRLSLSLWGDEEATTRRYIIGNVHRDDDNTFSLKPPSWLRTFHNWDQGPSNQVLFSVLSRLSHGPADTSGDDPGKFYFSERQIRLPSFLASLIAVAAAGWLTALLGFPRGAPVSAFLLALHPWFVRFGTDARGYALMMMFGLLSACFLLKALKTFPRMSWWLAFGASQFLMIYSHLSSVFLLVPLNLAALLLAWSPISSGVRNPFRSHRVSLYAGSACFFAGLTLMIYLPNLLQIPAFLETGRLAGEVHLEWAQDCFAYWMSGMAWHPWQPGNPCCLTLPDYLDQHHTVTLAYLAVLIAFYLAGVLALLLRKGARPWLIGLLLPVPLMVADAHVSGYLLYPWYMVGFLPLTFVVAGAGFDQITRSLTFLPRFARPLVVMVIAFAALALFAFVTNDQRQLYRSKPVEPLADSVHLARGVVNPFHPGIDQVLTLGFVHATRLYDPAMLYAGSDAEFLSSLREADLTNRPLSVNTANLGLARVHFPEAMALLENPEVFEPPVVLYGLQVPCTRYLYRYKPGGLARAAIDK